MPSMKKMFRSRKSKSCSSLGGDPLVEAAAPEVEAFKADVEALPKKKASRRFSLESLVKKGARRGSFGRKPGTVLGRSLKHLLAKRSIDKWTPASNDVPVFVVEDSARTTDLSESNPSWDHTSVTDTALSTSPPRNSKTPTASDSSSDDEVKENPVESIDEAIETIDEAEDNTAMFEGNIEAAFDFIDEAGDPELEMIASVASVEELEQTEPSQGSLEGEHLVVSEEAEQEELKAALLVPTPPFVQRNEDLLDLLSEANIKTEAHPGVVPVEVRANCPFDEEQVLGVIQETEETEDDEPISFSVEKAVALQSEEEATSETESESGSESLPEAITATKVRDSMALIKVTPKQEASRPPVLLWAVMAGVLVGVALFLATSLEGGFEMANFKMPSIDMSALKSIELPVAWTSEDFNFSSVEFPSLDVSSIELPALPSLDWTDLQAEVKALFNNAPEETARQGRSILHDASSCKGVYCGFY